MPSSNDTSAYRCHRRTRYRSCCDTPLVLLTSCYQIAEQRDQRAGIFYFRVILNRVEIVSTAFAQGHHKKGVRLLFRFQNFSLTILFRHNAVAESFFGSLKKEHIKKHTCTDRDAATLSLAEYIDDFYNSVRRDSYLGGVSSNEFEAVHSKRKLGAH
ncbi:IS3 family transposase [Achromobacter sp. ACM04]|uniref:IS3 family transposase n=1 Tax=Achromobacter sp. ACM04 TaxID=2769312 RepID=UPI001784CAB0|nr:IS3 family transposase [Achromobacter sp. ACM04]